MWRAISNKISAIGGVRVKLNILSGLHKGVEHRLEPGSYTFGRSADCNFALEEGTLQPLAFKLNIGSRSVDVVAEQPLGVNNGQETLLLQSGFRTKMSVPGEIHVGDVTLGIEPDDKSSSVVAWATRNPIVTGLTAIAILCLGVFVSAQATYVSDKPDNGGEVERIQTILGDRQLDGKLDVIQEGDGWLIRGEVNERRDAEELFAALRGEGLDVDMDITDRRTTLRNVETVLAAFPGRFSARWEGDDIIAIKGHVANDERREGLQNALRNDIRGVDRLDLNIRTHNDILRELRERLASSGLNAKMELMLADDTIIANGRLSDSDMQSWREVKIWYDLRYEGILPIRTDFSEPGPVGPDIDIRAIWSGTDPYVIGGNGNKYSQGSILPGGWQIDDILSDRVVLNRNGAMIELRM